MPAGALLELAGALWAIVSGGAVVFEVVQKCVTTVQRPFTKLINLVTGIKMLTHLILTYKTHKHRRTNGWVEKALLGVQILRVIKYG